MKPILNVENLQKYYKTKGSLTKAVEHVSFQVQKGEFVGIMGASGSGKTTLLNCISTIDRPTAGKISIREQDVTALGEEALAAFRREELGFIFQDFNLLDTLSGRDNISLALAIAGCSSSAIVKRVENVASVLGVEDILDKYPYEMSGGQRQRIACARAIAAKPALILADEPTGALDSKSAGMLLKTFGMLNDQLNATIIMVTHDAFTASHCNRILFMKDGRIFNELMKGSATRKEFFEKIIQVVSLLGGDLNHVI